MTRRELDRRRFLGAAAAAGLAASLPAARRARPRRRRNLVFVMTDDQRWDSLGCMGHPFLKTPNLDRLAREGAHCVNTFVTTSLCSPSRASILSGQYAHQHGVLDNRTLLPEGTPTYPALLKQAGYRTAFVGKWHMGGSTDEPRPFWDHWASFRGQGRYFDPVMNVNGVREKTKGYITDTITEHAVRWVKEQAGNGPFCLAVGHKATHARFRPPPRHADLFEDVEVPDPMEDTDVAYRNAPAWVRAQRDSWHGVDGMYNNTMSWEDFYRDYHRCLVSVDEGMGGILEALEDAGILDETLVVFTSDNGFLHGEHGLIDKRCMYEESIRIPLLVRGPEVAAPGVRIEEMILNIDFPSFLLDAAGIEAPASMQGRSFLPLLQGRKVSWRTSWLYEYFFERSFPQTPTVLGVRTPRWKLMTFHGIWDRNELYDLQEDPGERRNLIRSAEAREKRRELRAELMRLLETYGCRWNPAWKR